MIAIIDYNAGNLRSVERAVSHLGFQCTVTNDVEEILGSERIIFPGVGAAGSAMTSLKKMGLDQAILEAFTKGKPILGICLGTQIIMGHSMENDTACLGIVDGDVREFQPDMKSEDGSLLKIPHMGWNRIEIKQDHPVLAGVRENDEFYFVHSFYPDPAGQDNVLGVTDYGISFPSVIGFKNMIATQFHLEKSGEPGLTILKNFCRWEPC